MIDTHCHLNFPEIAEELDDVLARAAEAGVHAFVIPGTTPENSASAVAVAEKFPSVYAGAGIHPLHATEFDQAGRALFSELLGEANSLVAIGEVGLDYYREEDGASRTIQEKVFREMIAIAKENSLPLIIHSREAFADTYAILKEQAAGHPTVIHCFTGSAQEAKAWLDMGCHISLTGIITYKRNGPMREMVKTLPLDRLMIETDAPYLAPEGFRGQRCEPMHVRQVALCLTELFDSSFDYIDTLTTQTAEKFFTISCG